MFHSLSQWFKGQSHKRRAVPAKTRPKKARLQLEALEERTVPAVFNVNSTADIFSPPTGTVTLRAAIEAANASPGGNTINLTVPGTYAITLPGTPGETDNAAGEFAIGVGGGNLSIVNTSAGTVIVNGNHLARVFDINPANTDNPATKNLVTMQGFTIEGGIAQPGDGSGGTGGGIRDQGNTSLTLTNMIVTGNSATADGGGVSMENAPASTPWTLTVNDSTISDNHAGDAGGGIEEDGMGRVFINAGTVITGNTCVNQGGGVWLDATADGVASVTITNPGTGYTSPPTVTFSAPQNAGRTTATGTAIITGGVVTGVTITNPGSGYTAAPTVTVSAPPAGTTATGTANLGFLNSAALTMTGVLVSNNSALNGPTGGIGNSGNGAVSISSCTVENNFSGSTGGGFGDQNGLGTLAVSDSLFRNNTAVGDGGGIQEGGPTTTITFTDLVGNNSGGNGGGLIADGTTMTVTGSDFINNTASGNGGGIEVGTVGSGASGSVITNCTITGNRALNNAGANGGGIDAGPTFALGALTLLNDTINGNFASAGGGISWSGTMGTSFSVENTILAQNTATTGPDANNAAGTFTDNGGNLLGVSGAGSGNTGFTAATTQTGTVAKPLNPDLGALQNNGGPTAGASGSAVTLTTEALLPGSPAINNGVAAGAPTTDERGFNRPDTGPGAAFDVGAFEFQDAILSVAVALTSPPVAVNTNATFSITVTNTSTGSLPPDNSTLTVTLSPGLTAVAGSPLTFTLGAIAPAGVIPPGASETFTVQATATALGSQTVSASVTSPDSNPNTVSASTSTTILTAQQRFVQALYVDDLHRLGSIAELNAWVAVLNAPGGSQAVVAAYIVGSFESRDDLVKSWYQTYLGRAAQAGEELSWVNALTGSTVEQVLSTFLATPEFYSHAQTLITSGTGDQRFVGALYQLLLDRTPSAAETAGWINALPALGYRGVALEFLQSLEFRIDLVTGYYNNVLHRAPDAAGLTYWVTSSFDAATILIAFESGTEFYTNG